jgi:DNA-binding HxlR family transcriptional regulator
MAKKKQLDTDPRRSDCPVACVLDLVGDRWTLLVVRDLVLGVRQFEKFLDSPEGIATNVLADRLRRLEQAGYITKSTDPTDRRKSVYELTEQGESLRGLMRMIARWGLKNIEGTAVPERVRGLSKPRP